MSEEFKIGDVVSLIERPKWGRFIFTNRAIVAPNDNEESPTLKCILVPVKKLVINNQNIDSITVNKEDIKLVKFRVSNIQMITLQTMLCLYQRDQFDLNGKKLFNTVTKQKLTVVHQNNFRESMRTLELFGFVSITRDERTCKLSYSLTDKGIDKALELSEAQFLSQ